MEKMDESNYEWNPHSNLITLKTEVWILWEKIFQPTVAFMTQQKTPPAPPRINTTESRPTGANDSGVDAQRPRPNFPFFLNVKYQKQQTRQISPFLSFL